MKDILVHLDGSTHRKARLDLAASIASRFGARLTGLFAQVESDAPSMVAQRASEHLARAADTAEAEFVARCAAAQLDHRWWRLPHGEPAYVVGETEFLSRFTDLIIVGQHDPYDTKMPRDFIEQLIVNSGRPVLVVPRSGDYVSAGRRVAVAWNAAREASRAVHDALPFLISAEHVTILAVRDSLDGKARPFPTVNIAEHLTHWGVKAEMEVMPAEDIGIMDLLLSRSFDLGCDLLVMGGQGAEGLKALLNTSGTRHVLSQMTLPVLLSN